MADEISKTENTEASLQADAVQASVPSTETAPDTPAPFPQQSQGQETPQKDVVMADISLEQAASPAASPAPARTGTPAQASRAASAHPDPGFSMPSEAPPHGDSTRRYLNTKVTGVLLEGMKMLAKDQPDEPLRVLGEYLIQRSKELGGSA
ncbi:COMPASS (complex proteins associated with Set1p) component [Lecanicillium sp. MT-2017a]|nr:COMPASS (complex proteins associated with Set1p) component [Lecanicillium sp. MT-2017a]